MAGYADCGLPAGCGVCFLMVMCYSMEGLEAFVARWPFLGLQVYLDDLTLTAEAPPGPRGRRPGPRAR